GLRPAHGGAVASRRRAATRSRHPRHRAAARQVTLRRVLRRSIAVGMAAAGVAQELWSPRSDDPLAAAIGWAGPWALAAAPVALADAVLTEDGVEGAAALAALALRARRMGGTPRPVATD